MRRESINRLVFVSLFLVLLGVPVFPQSVGSSIESEVDSELTYYAAIESNSEAADQVNTRESLVTVKIHELNSAVWVNVLVRSGAAADCYVGAEEFICSAYEELSEEDQRLVEESLGPIRSLAAETDLRSVAHFRQAVECEVYQRDNDCEDVPSTCVEGVGNGPDDAYFGVLVSDRRRTNDLGVLVSDLVTGPDVHGLDRESQMLLVRIQSCGAMLPLRWLNLLGD